MSQKNLLPPNLHRNHQNEPKHQQSHQLNSAPTSIKNYKIPIFITILTIITLLYLFTLTPYYSLTQLSHLDDRIRFGRLQFHKKSNFTSGSIHINNHNKIFNITFNEQQIFIGGNQHFLIFLQNDQPQISGKTVWEINDNVKKMCKIQKINNIFQHEINGNNNAVRITGNFQDCKNSQYEIILEEIFQENQDNTVENNNNINNKNNQEEQSVLDLDELENDEQNTQHSQPHPTKSSKLKITIKAPQNFNRIYTLFNLNTTSDQFFGLGTQYTHLSLPLGTPFSTFTRSKGLTQGQQPITSLLNIFPSLYPQNIQNPSYEPGSYYTSPSSIPIWFSDKKISYKLQSYAYSAWINNKLLVWDNQFTVIWAKKNSFKDVLKEIRQNDQNDQNSENMTENEYNKLKQGAILSFDSNNLSNITQKYTLIKQSGTKISSIHLNDINNIQLDHITNEQLTNLRQFFKKDNISLSIQISPFLSSSSKYFTKALSQNLFLRIKSGQFYHINNKKYLLDIQNNQQSYYMFKEIIKELLTYTDAKQIVLKDGELYPIYQIDGKIQENMKKHNKFTNNYIIIVKKILNQLLGEHQSSQIHLTSTSGYLQTNNLINSLSTGPYLSTFHPSNGLSSCLTAILSSSLIGYSNPYCNIGGDIDLSNHFIGQFSSVERTEMLLIRWMQLTTFITVFKMTEGNNENKMVQIYKNKFLLENFAFYSNIFNILHEYKQKNLNKSSSTPLIHPIFTFTPQIISTPTLTLLQTQFYLGTSILIAPYLTPQSQRKYFLPKGQWKLLWNSKIYKGCNCQRIWKEKLPAVFIKSNEKQTEKILEKVKNIMEKYKEYIEMEPKLEDEEL